MSGIDDWKRFDYHTPPPGTDVDPHTGRLRREEKTPEDKARTEVARTRERDPDVVIRVARSVVSEAEAVLNSLCFEYERRGTAFVFRTPDDRRLAESVLGPLGARRRR